MLQDSIPATAVAPERVFVFAFVFEFVFVLGFAFVFVCVYLRLGCYGPLSPIVFALSTKDCTVLLSAMALATAAAPAHWLSQCETT